MGPIRAKHRWRFYAENQEKVVREAVAYFTEYMIKNTVQINSCLQILKVTKRLLYLQQNYKKDLFMEDKKKFTINFDKAPTEEEMKMKPSAVRISVIEGTKKKK